MGITMIAARMRLLTGVDIAPFCRLVWLSEPARVAWEPTIPRIASLVSELEILSVAHGQRRCAWQTFGEDSLPANAGKWARMGLVSLPVRYTANFEGFAHRHAEPQPGQSKSVCVIISRSLEDAVAFADAHHRGDHDTQGDLLGFPACCRNFFSDVWGQGFYDPVWQSALNSPHEVLGERRIRVVGHPFVHPILRYIGLRVGFHIPHSFDCAETIRLAEQRLALATTVDPDTTTLLRALLAMPLSWDCYHGTAIVRTPIFNLVTSSVPAAECHIIELAGTFTPREAVAGTEWPNREASAPC